MRGFIAVSEILAQERTTMMGLLFPLISSPTQLQLSCYTTGEIWAQVNHKQNAWMFPSSKLAENQAQSTCNHWRNSPLRSFMTCGLLPFAFVVTRPPGNSENDLPCSSIRKGLVTAFFLMSFNS